MNVKKKIEENDQIKFLHLYIILWNYSPTKRQKDIEEAQRQYELYKDLNPRYFENIITLKEAKLKVDSSDIMYNSKYNIFRPW
ncbi:MAG: hypothetical protein ACFFBE_04115 [Promethearchaeota archaeon]